MFIRKSTLTATTDGYYTKHALLSDVESAHTLGSAEEEQARKASALERLAEWAASRVTVYNCTLHKTGPHSFKYGFISKEERRASSKHEALDGIMNELAADEYVFTVDEGHDVTGVLVYGSDGLRKRVFLAYDDPGLDWNSDTFRDSLPDWPLYDGPTLRGSFFCGHEASEYAKAAGYLDYATLAAGFNAVLCNGIIELLQEQGAEDLNGADRSALEEAGPGEIFQYFIIDDAGADIIMRYTDDPLFLCERLGVYVWGVTHFGTAWTHVLTDVKLEVH